LTLAQTKQGLQNLPKSDSVQVLQPLFFHIYSFKIELYNGGKQNGIYRGALKMAMAYENEI
jgi:hypothetical protein